MLRKLRGLTQASLAVLVQLDQSSIARIEAQQRTVSLLEGQRIAVALGVSMDKLLDYPGAQQDKLLHSLVIAPQLELEARLEELRRFAAGTGDGTLQDLVDRLGAGVASFTARVPDPYEVTASVELTEGALAAAIQIGERHEQFSSDVLTAIRALAEPRTREATDHAVSAREEHRRTARNVEGRG